MQTSDDTTVHIQNHSWVGDYSTQGANDDAIRRFDYLLDTYNVLATVGVNNGTSSGGENALMSASYNAIAVGVSDGSHYYGDTAGDEAGRMKPEIVAPQNFTSYSTPIVGAAAAMLIDKANSTAGLSNATNTEAVKALLLGGATKEEFSGWSNTSTRPLDDRYGAGELNIYNSYHMLVGGESDASTSTDIGSNRGWDYGSASDTQEQLYFFDVAAGARDLSIVLTWNRKISDGTQNPNTWSAEVSLADLALQLYQASGFTLGDSLAVSNSDVDNIEHLWLESLTAGRYAMGVSVDSDSTLNSVDYGLAWRLTPIPEPTVALALAFLGLCVLHTGRRRCAS